MAIVFGTRPRIESDVLRCTVPADALDGFESDVSALFVSYPRVAGDVRYLTGDQGYYTGVAMLSYAGASRVQHQSIKNALRVYKS